MTKRFWAGGCLFAGLLLALLPGLAEESSQGDGGQASAAEQAQEGAEADVGEQGGASGPLALLLTVDDAIGPATRDYITRGLDTASEREAALVILKLDTPGGLTASTRDIVKAIRNSSVPVATWVAPGGARAASAGTYILYASHVAVMAPATNVGAATPVSMGGGSPAPAPEPKEGEGEGQGQGGSGDSSDGQSEKGSEGADGADGAAEEAGGDKQSDAAPQSAKKRKAVNDAAAWIRGLAQDTGRNADWAERAVREGVSLTAEEAVEQNVTDFLAGDLSELFANADGRSVEVLGRAVELSVANARVESIEPDWRSQLLAVITNPTVAYLLMMIGIYGLLLEGYNPGAIVPGTVGAICLLLALYAFQVLPVNFAGLLLILLGIILIVSEALAPSFGALGFGGVVALVVGSIILMDTDVPGFEIAIEVISAVATVSGVLMLALVWMAVKAWRRPVVSGGEAVEQATGETLSAVGSGGGWVHLEGERWRAHSEREIEAGRRVRVVKRDGLTVRVEPIESNEE